MKNRIVIGTPRSKINVIWKETISAAVHGKTMTQHKGFLFEWVLLQKTFPTLTAIEFVHQGAVLLVSKKPTFKSH